MLLLVYFRRWDCRPRCVLRSCKVIISSSVLFNWLAEVWEWPERGTRTQLLLIQCNWLNCQRSKSCCLSMKSGPNYLVFGCYCLNATYKSSSFYMSYLTCVMLICLFQFLIVENFTYPDNNDTLCNMLLFLILLILQRLDKWTPNSNNLMILSLFKLRFPFSIFPVVQVQVYLYSVLITHENRIQTKMEE